jgi:hypothetical protein
MDIGIIGDKSNQEVPFAPFLFQSFHKVITLLKDSILA